MMSMDAEMTANVANSNLPALPVIANTMGEDSSLSGNGVPEWYGSAETEMSQLMTSNAFGQAGADYDHEIHYRADDARSPANYVFNRDNELEREMARLEYERDSLEMYENDVEQERYLNNQEKIMDLTKERAQLNKVHLGAEDEAILANSANWSEDSTMLSGNGVPTYYGSAETFEAPMARYNPGKDDVNRVLASLRSRYSGLRVKGNPVYLTMRSGSSNKYHVFVRTNKGNFNGYGRIGYAPTIHGPMSDSEYDRKIRAKQRNNKGYEETKFAEAGYTPMSETPSPHEPYSFMDEMTPNGEFITSDEFMELMSETIDGMAMRYEKPSMFGSPLAMGVGGVLVAALGYKMWSKRSDTTE
jgi:hypothetical protein